MARARPEDQGIVLSPVSSVVQPAHTPAQVKWTKVQKTARPKKGKPRPHPQVCRMYIVQAAVHSSTLFNMYTNDSLATYLVFCIEVEC